MRRPGKPRETVLGWWTRHLKLGGILIGFTMLELVTLSFVVIAGQMLLFPFIMLFAALSEAYDDPFPKFAAIGFLWLGIAAIVLPAWGALHTLLLKTMWRRDELEGMLGESDHAVEEEKGSLTWQQAGWRSWKRFSYRGMMGGMQVSLLTVFMLGPIAVSMPIVAQSPSRSIGLLAVLLCFIIYVAACIPFIAFAFRWTLPFFLLRREVDWIYRESPLKMRLWSGKRRRQKSRSK